MQNPSIFNLSTVFNNRNPEKLQVGRKDIKAFDNKQWPFQRKCFPQPIAARFSARLIVLRCYVLHVSDLLVGLLTALMATNQPAAVSNLVTQTTGLRVTVPDINDP